MAKKLNTTDDCTPQFVSSENKVYPQEYILWLKGIKHRYRQAQSKAIVKVNCEMLRFYWALGKDIVSMHVEELWGKGVMNQLSLDLRAAFPGQDGFSVTNLKYMKRWYLFYYQANINRHQPGDDLQMPENFALVPWKHHVCIFTKTKTIGLLICRSKDDTVVEWSLQDINKPIGVSTYQLQEVVNRTIEEMSK